MNQTNTARIYLLFIADFIGSVMLGFLCISFLVTGVAYPVLSRDQQLLKSWGLESFFDRVLLLLLFTSLVLTSFIYYKSVNGLLKPLKHQSELPLSFHKIWFEFGPLGIVSSVSIVYIVESIAKWIIFSDPFGSSPVILSILLYLLGGYVIGQTLVKTTKIFLWEHGNSARIFVDLNGKLIRRP